MLQLQRIQERKSELQVALTLKALSLCRHEGEVEASAGKRGPQQQEVAIASPSTPAKTATTRTPQLRR